RVSPPLASCYGIYLCSHFLRRAAAQARGSAGRSSAMVAATMPATTISSSLVKPRRGDGRSIRVTPSTAWMSGRIGWPLRLLFQGRPFHAERDQVILPVRDFDFERGRGGITVPLRQKTDGAFAADPRCARSHLHQGLHALFLAHAGIGRRDADALTLGNQDDKAAGSGIHARSLADLDLEAALRIRRATEGAQRQILLRPELQLGVGQRFAVVENFPL